MVSTRDQPTFPIFGAVLNRVQNLDKYGFYGTMYRCHTKKNSHGQYQEVNILHISTDVDGSMPELNKILEYMCQHGFVVEPPLLHNEGKFSWHWRLADILLLGCNSKDAARAYSFMLEMERGLHGVLWGWDALVYFTDDSEYGKILQLMGDSGVYSNSKFSADGIFLVRSHLRRRYDYVAHNGGLSIMLEALVWESTYDLVVEDNDKDTFGDKMTNLTKKIVNKDGVKNNTDWKAFVAAVDMLRNFRNLTAHPNKNQTGESIEKSWGMFDNAMANYGHIWRYLRRTNHYDHLTDVQLYQDVRRMYTILARMTAAWLDECDKSILSNR